MAVCRWVRCSRLLPVRDAEFLRAGQVLAAVSQRFGFLLQQAQFLQVVRRKADQMALPGNRNLKRLANPPSCIGGEPGAVADIETIDRLHQTANGFLKQIGVTERMMAEALGNVSGKANVRRGKTMFVVNIAIVETANGGRIRK